MAPDSASHVEAMEGGGFYNRHSGLQASNLQSAVPLFVDAARAIPLDHAGDVRIVDYGASQGRNSMVPMAAAIDAIRTRDPGRPVSVAHTDLPSNDFAALFTMLAHEPISYLRDRRGIFPSAIGRSYFEPILSPASVDLGWSSNALHWMSRNPVDVADHGWAVLSSHGAAREAVRVQLEEDWTNFLRARASELRAGAMLICQFMGRGPQTHGFEWMASVFWESWLELEREGLLSSSELLAMTSPSAGRSIAEIQAPFANGSFEGLRLEFLTIVEAPDPYWDAYQESGDAKCLAQSWANMMRAANGPNFVARLDPARDKSGLLDEAMIRLVRHIERAPMRSQSYNAIVALRKAV